MDFVFNCSNHSDAGRRSLEDLVAIMGAQLRALGHRTASDDGPPHTDGQVTVLFEGFTEASAPVVAAARAAGARFVIVGTEEPSPAGFNHGADPEMVARQRAFPDVARHAEAIFALVPGAEAWYGQHAPAARAELGYAPDLVRPDSREAPDHDFGFYGSMTPRRDKLLRLVARKCSSNKNAVKVISNFATREHRDAQMQRARVILQIRKFKEMGLVSSSRCNVALHIGRPVLAEPHDLSAPWDQVVRFSPTAEDFLRDAVHYRMAWRGLHAEQFARFKTEMSPDRCLGEALRATCLALRVAA